MTTKTTTAAATSGQSNLTKGRINVAAHGRVNRVRQVAPMAPIFTILGNDETIFHWRLSHSTFYRENAPNPKFYAHMHGMIV